MLTIRQIKPEPGRDCDYVILAENRDRTLTLRYAVVYGHLCPSNEAKRRARAIAAELLREGKAGKWEVVRHSPMSDGREETAPKLLEEVMARS